MQPATCVVLCDVGAGKRRREVETGFKDTALLGCSAGRPAAAASAEDGREAVFDPNAAVQAEQSEELEAAARAAGTAATDAC